MEEFDFSKYKKVTKALLQNFHDTSYLNSVLQLLGSIRNIASYFLNPKHQKIIADDIKHMAIIRCIVWNYRQLNLSLFF